jgi:phosphatidylglycerol:prolipoprotein diacylglycerol transferase
MSPPAGQGSHPKSSGQVKDASTAEPEALVVTHLFDPGREGEAFSAAIRVSGRRHVQGTPKAGDSFVREEQVERIVPGSGPISISSWIYGLTPGKWDVDATLRRRATGGDPIGGRGGGVERLARGVWSWRHWRVETAPTTPVRTRWALLAPIARIPGVIPGSFTALAALAIIAALIVQAVVVANQGIPIGTAAVVSLVAIVLGILGAKIWSHILNPSEAIVGPGWAVDGFLVVAAVVAVGLLLALDVPVGVYLDASAPGIFFAVAIGRLGCFFTGCCAGRPTSHRLGIWSSDRRIGARRIPAQLFESAAGVALGLVATLLVLGGSALVPGAVFAVTGVAYLAVRTILLRLRAEPRKFLWQRPVRVPRLA